MMEEIWKAIEGYEGKYEVSNLGRVRSLDMKFDRIWNGITQHYHVKGRTLKQKTDHKGYAFIGLSNGARHNISYFRVHQLVAKAFIPNPDNLQLINHKDENKQNNIVSNLEWCDYAYNNAYGNHGYKIAQARGYPVRQMTKDGQTVAEYYSAREASRRTGISVDCIYHCCQKRKQCKTAGGYRWRYIE